MARPYFDQDFDMSVPPQELAEIEAFKSCYFSNPSTEAFARCLGADVDFSDSIVVEPESDFSEILIYLIVGYIGYKSLRWIISNW